MGNPTFDLAAATTSQNGGVVLASTANVQGGVDATKAVTPASLKGAVGFSNYYASPQQAITLNATTTNTHGLGAAPIHASAEIVCVTTNLNYLVGDVVPITGDVNVQLFYNATSLGVVFGSSIQILNKTSHSLATITPADWKVVLKAWG